MPRFNPGVLYGNDLEELYDYAKRKQFALPAINAFNTNSINAALEAAAQVNSPVVIQFSVSSSRFLAGMGISQSGVEANVMGAVCGALHVQAVTKYYGVPVVLHTDHASKEWLPWVDGMIREGERYFKETGRPMFSSHMIDLSGERLERNLEVSASYLRKLNELKMGLEIELGATGGEEEGASHAHDGKSTQYTSPGDVASAYGKLSSINSNFTIAATFGNVHGLYNPDGIELRPEILGHCQHLTKEKFGTGDKPVTFVFHGGSGCSRAQLREAISHGVVKVNIDTDLQWAFWNGVKEYYESNSEYLQSQLGNPKGGGEPNKQFYEARAWLRKAEEGFIAQLRTSFVDLNACDRNY